MMENIKPIASWSIELHLLLSREHSGIRESFSCYLALATDIHYF